MEYLKLITFTQQESPSTWTQEAHRPPCSKYTLCCSSRGHLPPSWDLSSTGRYPLPCGGTPFSGRGYPLPRQGLPPNLGRVTPHLHPSLTWTWEGSTPPYLDLGSGYPLEVWTDTQSEKITLPHPWDAGGNEACVSGENWGFTDQSTLQGVWKRMPLAK